MFMHATLIFMLLCQSGNGFTANYDSTFRDVDKSEKMLSDSRKRVNTENLIQLAQISLMKRFLAALIQQKAKTSASA